MSKKTKVMLDMRGMFSRLIVERSTDSYGHPVVWIRWGGAVEPVIEATNEEAMAISDALRQVVSDRGV